MVDPAWGNWVKYPPPPSLPFVDESYQPGQTFKLKSSDHLIIMHVYIMYKIYLKSKSKSAQTNCMKA